MDEVIRILASKYEIDEEIVEKVIRSQFLFAKDTMEIGELESVHLHHFGKFAVKPRYSSIEKHDSIIKQSIENGFKEED